VVSIGQYLILFSFSAPRWQLSSAHGRNCFRFWYAPVFLGSLVRMGLVHPVILFSFSALPVVQRPRTFWTNAIIFRIWIGQGIGANISFWYATTFRIPNCLFRIYYLSFNIPFFEFLFLFLTSYFLFLISYILRCIGRRRNLFVAILISRQTLFKVVMLMYHFKIKIWLIYLIIKYFQNLARLMAWNGFANFWIGNFWISEPEGCTLWFSFYFKNALTCIKF